MNKLDELEKELEELYEEQAALSTKIEKKERERQNLEQLSLLNTVISEAYDNIGDIKINIFSTNGVVVKKGTILHSKLINCIKSQIQNAIEKEGK